MILDDVHAHVQVSMMDFSLSQQDGSAAAPTLGEELQAAV